MVTLLILDVIQKVVVVAMVYASLTGICLSNQTQVVDHISKCHLVNNWWLFFSNFSSNSWELISIPLGISIWYQLDVVKSGIGPILETWLWQCLFWEIWQSIPEICCRKIQPGTWSKSISPLVMLRLIWPN